jgi:hypothetical protein
METVRYGGDKAKYYCECNKETVSQELTNCLLVLPNYIVYSLATECFYVCVFLYIHFI